MSTETVRESPAKWNPTIPKTPFRPERGDLTRDTIMPLVRKAVRKYGGLRWARVLFIYTCRWCGNRNAIDDHFYDFGTCCTCGGTTRIRRAGFEVWLRYPARRRAPAIFALDIR